MANFSKNKKSTTTTKTVANGAVASAAPSAAVALTGEISKLSLTELMGVVKDRKESEIESLRKSEIALTESLAKVRADLAALTGEAAVAAAPKRRGRKPRAAQRAQRAQNDQPLNQVIHGLMTRKGSPMGISEVIEAVGKTSYKSNAKNMYPVVFTALKNTDMFRRVARGQYQAIAD